MIPKLARIKIIRSRNDFTRLQVNRDTDLDDLVAQLVKADLDVNDAIIEAVRAREKELPCEFLNTSEEKRAAHARVDADGPRVAR